jgi:long-chain acyl-CoA synthetase
MPFITRSTITKTFLDRATLTPGRVGVQFKRDSVWKKLTFREYYNECRSVSYGLNTLGLKQGDRVAIISNTRYEWALSDMAIIGSRYVTVPIYPSSTSSEHHYILEHAGATVAIVENAAQLKKIVDKTPACLKTVVIIDAQGEIPAIAKKTPEVRFMTLDELRIAGIELERLEPGLFERNLEGAEPDDLFTICYTSGTTGMPKGVMLSHGNLMSVLKDCAEVFADYIKPEGEIILSFLPLSHILARVESMAIHVFGWREAFAENLDKLMENLTEVRPTIVFAVPRLFEKAYGRVQEGVQTTSPAKKKVFDWALARGRKYNLPRASGGKPSLVASLGNAVAKKAVFREVIDRFGGRLKFAVCGGAPLSKEIGEFFQAIGIDALEGYGLTETCAPVALNSPAQPKYGTVGRPLPEVSVRIAEDGEILLKSKKLFKGYYRAPEETAEVIVDGWFHTGDIGHLDEEGFLHITDRKKDIIVTSAGKNIAPQKIEAMAKPYPLISQLLVHGDRRNFLTALITLNRETAIQYAAEQQILFSEFQDLVRHPKLISRVQKIVDEINSQLASFETIKKFLISAEDFTVERGELTPSLKVKRTAVEAHYLTELNQLYS